MHRKFILHVHPHAPLIDEVRSVVEPMSIIMKDWVPPVRTIPTIQFFPESRELIEGEENIRKYIESLKPRPMAQERVLPAIKTKPEPQPTPAPEPAEPEPAPEPAKPETASKATEPIPVPTKPAIKSTTQKKAPRKKSVSIKE